MTARIAIAIAPVYLALSMLLGGSGQGILSNLLLQVGGAIILAWVLTTVPSRDGRVVHWLRIAVVLGLAWIFLQLVPLPPELWAQLPGREQIAKDYDLLGTARPWRPISLDPEATIDSLMSLLPFAAMLALTVRIIPQQPLYLVVTIVAVTVVSVFIGLTQRLFGEAFYFYPVHNTFATGPFANSNHMAALLLVAIPFVAALTSRWIASATSRSDRIGALVAGGAIGSVLLLGIVTNGSFAILLLGPPVLAASSLLAIPRGKIRTGRLFVLLSVIVTASVAVLIYTAIASANAGEDDTISARKDIWTQSLGPLKEHFPIGSGLGTFEPIYSATEDVGRVDSTYINHAHNDYLQIAIELGVPGILLILAFLIWWTRRVLNVWSDDHPPPFSRAATISAAVLLAHSFVDYPLRTAALATLFAATLGLMLIPRASIWRQKRDGREEARHLRLEDLD